jgi:hypothetical protein
VTPDKLVQMSAEQLAQLFLDVTLQQHSAEVCDDFDEYTRLYRQM